MRALLIALNAKYIHSNLAVYSLKAAAGDYASCVETAEYTINQPEEWILKELYRKKPDLAAFSCYIWNIGTVLGLAEELKKVLPRVKIWLGGPEVSYDIEEGPLSRPFIDGILIGEGEASFRELLRYYAGGGGELSAIRGIAYKAPDIRRTLERPVLDLDSIPFPYADLSVFKNRIIYYESSRGCPFECSYCLSSLEKGVRFRSLELVRDELSFFLDARVRQVKFVDRTFNCSPERALAIWRFIREHDNGITNFHFELGADLLTGEQISLLQEMRPGLVQLEIGVQSVNPDTIRAIRRKTDFSKVSAAVQKLEAGNNIHCHLDLIAGLPQEDFSSFRHSFNEVYALRPQQLQLGFLKVLKGTPVQNEPLCFCSRPPYEVLKTPWLSYEELLLLKQVEEMTEVYYNSGQFTMTVRYLEHFFESPFDLFLSLGRYYEEKGLEGLNHARIRRYELLLRFFSEGFSGRQPKESEVLALKELMVYDLYLRERLKSRPSFAPAERERRERAARFYADRERLVSYLPDCGKYDAKQLAGRTHVEFFSMDIKETAVSGRPSGAERFVLFDYGNREPLYGQASTVTGPVW